MMKPHQMSSVIITGPNSLQETIIKELHNLKIIHIVDHSKNELADIGKPSESASRLSETLVRIRALIAALSIKKEERAFETGKSLLEIETITKKLNQEASSNIDELRKTEEQIAKNHAAKNELEILKGIDVPLESFTSYKSLACFTGYIGSKSSINFLKGELSKITDRFMLFGSVARKKQFIAMFVDAKNKEQASSILNRHNFSPVNFSNIGNLRGNASNNLKKLEDEEKKLK
ncbi:hypothetical protein HYX05_01820, partial [Candidatus Woesearchaeota archaeon]|nr:hypothetical protein [Candidatus Woesearchaeota archaeon]